MKHVAGLLAVLIVLCSGCGTRQADNMPPPTVLILPDCPSPEPPVLPPINESLPFDGSENMAILTERDDTLRLYIYGLEATILCYRKGKAGNESK